jgi:hypothetical protein
LIQVSAATTAVSTAMIGAHTMTGNLLMGEETMPSHMVEQNLKMLASSAPGPVARSSSSLVSSCWRSYCGKEMYVDKNQSKTTKREDCEGSGSSASSLRNLSEKCAGPGAHCRTKFPPGQPVLHPQHPPWSCSSRDHRQTQKIFEWQIKVLHRGVLCLMHSCLHIVVEDFWNVCGVLDIHGVVGGVDPAFDCLQMLQELSSNCRGCSILGLDVCTLALDVHLVVHHQADEGVFEVLLGE